MVGARVGVTLGIALVQMAVFVGLAAAAFGLTLTGSWWAAIPLLMVGTLCFMSIGLLAGAITKTTEGGGQRGELHGAADGVPGWFVLPAGRCTAMAAGVLNLLPLKHLNDGMLDVMVRGEGPQTAGAVPMAILAAFTVVVTLVAARLFRWETT